MDKKTLSQLSDLIEESKDLKNKIEELTEEIDDLKNDAVIDVVHGTTNDIRYAQCLVKIEGYTGDVYRKEAALKIHRNKLKELSDRVDHQILEAQDYINGIEDSRIRMIITMRYVERRSWQYIANKLRSTADSVRMECKRFFEKG